MDSSIAALKPTATHTAWTFAGHRFAVAHQDGHIQVWDRRDTSSSFSCTSTWKAQEGPLLKIVWAPPEFGSVVASCSTDGSVSFWEEVGKDDGSIEWRLVAQLQDNQASVLDLQFGNCLSGLKLVTAGADGHVKVYETSNFLVLKDWQLQAEFPNVANLKKSTGRITCTSSSISWRPPVDSVQRPVFVLGYNTSSQQFSTAKVWEFAEAYQRWQMLAELCEADEKPEPVYCVSWAPNIGRPFELVAVASGKTVSIWRLEFPSDSLGRLVVTRAAHLMEYEGEVWHLDWDMTGMTLATSGSDGNVRLWQSNFSGEWQQQGIIESN